MIMRVEIVSEALPFNGIDAGFRNTHDRDFQKACLEATKDVLQQTFEIDVGLIGRLSARIECRNNGHSSRSVVLPGENSPVEKKVWSEFAGRLVDEGAVKEIVPCGYRYAPVLLVFQGFELLRIGIMLSGDAHKSPGENERFKRLVAIFGSMASRAVSLEELRYLSSHDALTGLANRTLFLQQIAKHIATSRACARKTVLFEVRLDSLGEVNNNFGFQAGDELILEAARRLSALNKSKAFVARVGGSKFMLLLRYHRRGEFGVLMRKVEDALEAPIRICEQELRMNVEIGCVALDDPGLHPVEVAHRAETAVSDARGRAVALRQKAYIYRDGFFQAEKANSQLNLMVRQAEHENRFFLLYQPVVDLRRNHITGCEALLRMRDPHGGIVEAAAFMDAVVRIRHQSTMDRWVFNQVIGLPSDEIGLRQRMDTKGFFIAMNCDPGVLSQEGVAQEWLAGLSQVGFDPRCFVLEVVENPYFFENAALEKNIRDLRKEGVRIAVDDFGSGYSNLRHLASLPVDIVKLDRGFLQKFEGGNEREALVIGAMLDLCAELGYETVCEGVETRAHVDFLGGVDSRCAQGYFYGKPMSLPAVLDLAEKYDLAATVLENCHVQPDSSTGRLFQPAEQ